MKSEDLTWRLLQWKISSLGLEFQVNIVKFIKKGSIQTLHMHENLCTLLIPLCKNNLNLPMSSSFFFYPVLGCLLLLFIMLVCLLPLCAGLILFVCLFVFTENDFVAQLKTRYLLVNPKAGFHSSYFGDRKKITE